MIHYFTTCYKYLEKNKKIFITLCICFWLFTFFSVAVEVPAWEESEYEEQQKIKTEWKANKEIAIKEAPLEIVRQMQQLNNNLEKLSQELKFLRE